MTLCPSKKCFRHGNCHARLVFFKGNRLKYSACCCFQFLYGKKNTFQKRNWEVVFVKRYERGERIGAEIIRQFSQKKLPKGSFRARLPPNFTEEASKTSVSRDASSKIHRTSFQNELFARCFRQFCKKKLPKWSFRARLLPNFTEQASKTSVSRDASDNFHEKFAFRYSFAQSTHRFLREGSSAKSKMCLALQRRAFPNFKMYVSLQRRAQKCMNLSTVNRPASRTQKCEVLLQFWAIDTTFLARGLTESKWNLRFATVLGDRHHVFSERVDR